MYKVFLTGGKLDGQKQKEFSDFQDALEYSKELEKEFKNEFDPLCGGVAIIEIDEKGNRQNFDY